MGKTVQIENAWLRKVGSDELVLSVCIKGEDIEILRTPIPVDGELSHCVHAAGIASCQERLAKLMEENADADERVG